MTIPPLRSTPPCHAPTRTWWRGRLIPIAALSLTAACGGNPSHEVEFSVVVARLPAVMREELARGRALTDTIRLRLPGQVFDPPRTARSVARDSIDRGTVLAASDADFSAFKAEDDAWIVATFAAAEQPEIAGFLADSVIRAGSRAMFRGIERQDVHAVAEFRTDSARYGFVFLHYTDAPRSHVVNTYLWEDGEWRRTNTIVRDRTTRFVNVVFESGWIRLAD